MADREHGEATPYQSTRAVPFTPEVLLITAVYEQNNMFLFKIYNRQVIDFALKILKILHLYQLVSATVMARIQKTYFIRGLTISKSPRLAEDIHVLLKSKMNLRNNDSRLYRSPTK